MVRWERFCFPHDPKYLVLSTKEVQEEQLGPCLGESGGEMLTVTTTTTTVRKACGLRLITVLMLGQYHWKGSRWPQKNLHKNFLGSALVFNQHNETPYYSIVLYN